MLPEFFFEWSALFRGGTTQYLVKWLNYSSFDNSWEDEENLRLDLVKDYGKPPVQPDRFIKAIDTLHLSVLTELKKNKSRGNVVIDFEHDCFRIIFYLRGRLIDVLSF